MDLLRSVAFCGLFYFSYSHDTVYMSEHCKKTYAVNGATFLRYKKSSGPTPPVDCKMLLSAPEKYRLSVRIDKLYMKEPTFGTCAAERLVLYSGSLNQKAKLLTSDKGLCGSTVPADNVLKTSDHSMVVEFFSTTGSVSSHPHGFELLITAFREGDCGADEVACCSGECLPGGLDFDLVQHCPDGSDESVEPCPAPPVVSVAAIVGITVGGLVILVVLIFTIIAVVKKRNGRSICHRQHKHLTREVPQGGDKARFYQMQTSTASAGTTTALICPSAPTLETLSDVPEEYPAEPPPPYSPTDVMVRCPDFAGPCLGPVSNSRSTDQILPRPSSPMLPVGDASCPNSQSEPRISDKPQFDVE